MPSSVKLYTTLGLAASLSAGWQYVFGDTLELVIPLGECPERHCALQNMVLLAPYLVFPAVLGVLFRHQSLPVVSRILTGICCGGAAAMPIALQLYLEDPTGDDTRFLVTFSLVVYGLIGSLIGVGILTGAQPVARGYWKKNTTQIGGDNE